MVNPKGGRGQAGWRWAGLRPRLEACLPNTSFDVLETTGPRSAPAQARALAEGGCSIVVAVGGDGTVSQVMNGLTGTDAALAVLPAGTGNDFARTLGFGPNIDAAVDALVVGERMRMDVGAWRVGNQSGFFINVAGLGFDSAVADRINRGFRHVRGSLAYFAAILSTLRTYRPRRLSGLIDGEPIEGQVMLCALANAQAYGGGLRIAPMASIEDGLLDLVMVGEFGTVEFLRNFGRLRRGNHLFHPKVFHRPFRRLEIEVDPPGPFLVDGELFGPGPVEVEIRPGIIEVIA